MPGVEDIVHEHKLDFTARLIRAATEAGARDPYQLGNQLAVLFEGARALATSLNDTSPLLHARSAAETLIDAATADTAWSGWTRRHGTRPIAAVDTGGTPSRTSLTSSENAGPYSCSAS